LSHHFNEDFMANSASDFRRAPSPAIAPPVPPLPEPQERLVVAQHRRRVGRKTLESTVVCGSIVEAGHMMYIHATSRVRMAGAARVRAGRRMSCRAGPPQARLVLPGDRPVYPSDEGRS
jgi:hypothetical protein